MKKYIVYPGYIKSEIDGDRQYISFGDLVELYGVNARECINGAMLKNAREVYPELIPLRPRSDGIYLIPETEP